ncbi:MAG: amino acid ABC transporter permease [Rhizobacter sp.]
MANFDLSLLLHGQYHDWLVNGILLSIQLTAATLLLALPLGTVVAMLRLSPVAALRALGWAYVESIRNVPLLAHLLFWYFAAPELLPESVKAWYYEGSVEFTSALIALTLYAGAYMAEDIRSGLRAVPQGQFDAGKALGLGFVATVRFVVMPQALRITVPPLLSQTLNLWKDTSVATVIGVAEMMYQAARVESASFRSAEAFVFVTSAYLVVSLLLTAVAELYQRRYPVRSR